MLPLDTAILMGVYHGAPFLSEQLDSIAQQSYKNWRLIISNDGSDTETSEILVQFQRQHGKDKVVILPGPKRGFVANFLSLVCHASIQADFYAFADQDDIWQQDKLAIAIDKLTPLSANHPGLYCSRVQLMDTHGNDRTLSPLCRKQPSFMHALVQNIANGNTMVFNDAARKLLCKAGRHLDVPVHDWWLYLAVSACGGTVHYDPYPSVRYRLHQANVIGWDNGLVGRTKRFMRAMQGQLREDISRNLDALSKIEEIITPSNQATLQLFKRARCQRAFNRFFLFKQSGIYRQHFFSNMTLAFLALMGRM